MHAGELRELITFERRLTGTPGGTVRDIYVHHCQTRAQIRTASTRDIERLAYLGEQVLYIVRIYFRTDLTPEMRISWNSPTGLKKLAIYGTPYDPDGLRTELIIGCTEEGLP